MFFLLVWWMDPNTVVRDWDKRVTIVTEFIQKWTQRPTPLDVFAETHAHVESLCFCVF